MFISLDGVVEAPDQWHFPYFNEEMGEAQLLSSDTFSTGVLYLVYGPGSGGRRPGRHDARLVGDHHELSAIACVEFGEQPTHVCLRRRV